MNPHYINTRYPIDVVYDKQAADEAVKQAKEVTIWAREQAEK